MHHIELDPRHFIFDRMEWCKSEIHNRDRISLLRLQIYLSVISFGGWPFQTNLWIESLVIDEDNFVQQIFVKRTRSCDLVRFLDQWFCEQRCRENAQILRIMLFRQPKLEPFFLSFLESMLPSRFCCWSRIRFAHCSQLVHLLCRAWLVQHSKGDLSPILKI